MANFKTHISFGIILGVIAAFLTGYFAFTSSLLVSMLILAGVIIGSILPDLDVDAGKPFKLIFGFFALLITGIMICYLIINPLSELKYLILLPIISFLFVRYVIGSAFRHFTAHRGIWHSIPAILIAVNSTMLALNYFELENNDKFLISISVGTGYLLHLVIDELFSLVNIGGLPFIPKKSLGTALKFFSRSILINFLVYLFLIFLLYLNYPIIIEMFCVK